MNETEHESTARAVLKWTIPVDDQWHEMPEAQVLMVASQGDPAVVCAWTIGAGKRTREVRVFGTGQPLPQYARYLGSCQSGPFVWHLFAAPDYTSDPGFARSR